ncbi:MAG: sensor histidine kinase [Actinomycetota bacterium]|nr:sensor histidine kinase [Actinomycetota bacterium]
MVSTQALQPERARFSHEAMLYRGPADRVEQLGAFIREGLALEETPCIVVDSETIEALTDDLGSDAEEVRFADMRVLGRNPGRLISLWTDLVGELAKDGRAIRGVGEPVWASRSAEELLECSRHESLLNLAFSDGPAWRLACPYDVSGLAPARVDEARRNHPMVTVGGSRDPSEGYRSPADGPAQLVDPLPPAPASASSWELSVDALAELRRAVLGFGQSSGVSPGRVEDFALAMDEVASNSIRHAEGGVARLWRTDADVIGEVEDEGTITDPLAGRRRPAPGSTSGFGLWLAHQLCDLVQVRSTPSGTIVRLRVAR